MIQLKKVNSDMNRVRMIDDRYSGSMYLTPDGDLAQLTASSDFKSLVRSVFGRDRDDTTNGGDYDRWKSVTSREIWAIQHHLLHH